MKTQSGLFSCSRGFTLAELLTTMAIVAILIGLIMPALSLVQKTAQKVRQKSQFAGIETALAGHLNDFGDYPDSSYTLAGGSGYCGAQKLAEAVVGWDGFGVHPQSAFRSDGMNDVSVPPDGNPELVYDVINGIVEAGTGTLLQSPVDNRNVRKGPYLELEASNAVKLADLYPGAVGTLDVDTYVLADMFGKVQHRRTRKRTGMPIMYYKADVGGTMHMYSLGPMLSNVYKVIDNDQIYTTQPPFGNTSHPLAANQPIFYDRTMNPNFPGSLIPPYPGRRPYRSESFILHSAGRDGLYGTADDVYNFDSEQ